MRGLGILLSFMMLAAPALAQWPPPPPPGLAPPRASAIEPLDHILPGIRNAHPGRFSDAEGPFPDAGGGMHYRIKWLTPQGRVIWFDTDARTGRVIGPWGPGIRFYGLPPLERRFGPGGWGRGFGRGWPGRGGRWPR